MFMHLANVHNRYLIICLVQYKCKVVLCRKNHMDGYTWPKVVKDVLKWSRKPFLSYLSYLNAGMRLQCQY
jgi:hypothetical protein